MLAAGWLYLRGVQTVRARHGSDDDASRQTRRGISRVGVLGGKPTRLMRSVSQQGASGEGRHSWLSQMIPPRVYPHIRHKGERGSKGYFQVRGHGEV